MNIPLILGLTIALEIVTAILRFGCGVTSRHVQQKLRLPVRIHHMYIGAAIALLGLVYPSQLVGVDVLDMGISMFLSDVVHHFIVLPISIKEKDFP